MTIKEAVEKGLWEEGLKLISMILKDNKEMNTEECIVGATILEHFGDLESMYFLIEKGLMLEPTNYELYLLLGNYYLNQNNNLAYLCYENALFWAEKKGANDDAVLIKEILDNCKKDYDTSVNNVSIVILSYNTLEFTRKCIDSIRENGRKQSCEIIIIDNASTDGSVEYLRSQKDILLIENKRNVGFPGGCNQGIRASNAENDIFLLNSDTLLMPNSLFTLRLGLYADEKNGAAGAVTNYSSNRQIVDFYSENLKDYFDYSYKNNIPAMNSLETKNMLVMFAMLIKRQAYEKTGELDERFSPGNYEDDDYGIRLIQNGYRNVVCWNSFIYHYGSRSFASKPDAYFPLLERNKEKLIDKVGFDYEYYKDIDVGISSMINSDRDAKIKILEIGCGLGELLGRIKYLYPKSIVHGIEYDKDVAKIAGAFNIVYSSIDECVSDKTIGMYDYVIFNEFLEKTMHPEKLLKQAKTLLKSEGCILASISNAMNAEVLYGLLTGDFHYTKKGALDQNKVRLYTHKEILELFDEQGYYVENICGSISKNITTDTYRELFDKLLQIDKVAEKKFFDIDRFYIRVKIKN